MGKYDKLIEKIFSGNADANIGFDELCHLLIRLGFESRTRGSHHLFFRKDVNERINLQCDGDKAKPYQVRQIRRIIFDYGLKGQL
jgi:predicted RNA binding protein YcfA (HicA-like mRNA interferase family)